MQVKERARNKLKDFFTMAPALGVTHLLAFTLTDVAPSMRIARLSAGPTLSFRVERYSLAKDIVNSSRRARSMSTVEYLSPPLVRLLLCAVLHASVSSSYLSARPRFLSTSVPHDSTTPHFDDENVPVPLPPSRAA